MNPFFPRRTLFFLVRPLFFLPFSSRTYPFSSSDTLSLSAFFARRTFFPHSCSSSFFFIIFFNFFCGILFFGTPFFSPLPPSDAVRKQENKYFRESLQFSIVTIKKKISPLWKPEIYQSRHFSRLKISYLNRQNPSNFPLAKFHSKYFGLLWVSRTFPPS